MGVSRFQSRGLKYQRSVGRNYLQGELVHHANCALGLLNALFALHDVQTLSVIVQAEQHKKRSFPGAPKHLPDFLSRRFAIQVSHHCPTIEDGNFTSGLDHAAALLFGSASIASATNAQAL